MPPPSWLVKDVVPTGSQGSFSVMYGPSGGGKTFMAMDLAMSVGSGIHWQGLPADKGLAVYVSGEGTGGLGQRANAWLVSKGLDHTDVDIAWLMESLSVYSSSEELDILLERFEELAEHKHEQPALVVIDTLARCFQGNENETEDMSDFVKGCDRIRTECGAAVLVIHHTNSSEGRERGNGALRAAADMMMLVTPGARGVRGPQAQGLLTVTCSKQKEALPFPLGVGRLVPTAGTGSVHVKVDWIGGDQ